MKKFVTILITLCMLVSMLPLAIHAKTTKTNLLSSDVLVHKGGADGNWEFQNGKLVAANKDINDTCLLSEIKIEKGKHVYLEATAVLNEGMAWGIMLSESSDGNPFEKWSCLNIDTEQMNSRMFFINTATKHGTPYGDPSIGFVNANDGKPHTLGLEILENGAMKLFLDGGMHTDLSNASFEGATVGLMTCKGSITCTSFTLTEGAPTGTTAYGVPRKLKMESTTNLLDANVLKHSTAGDFFRIADGKMTTNGRGDGDRAIMSDIFVNKGDHVYIEATGKMIEGGAWGLMFSTKNPAEQNPFDGWFCMNVDGYKSRIFSPNSGYDVASPREFYYLSDSLGNNVDVTLAVEITPDGTFYLTCNGVTYAAKKSENWNGAYIGLMTWNSNVEFSSATYSVVEGLDEGEPTPPPATTGDTVVIALAVAAVAILPVAFIWKKKERV